MSQTFVYFMVSCYRIIPSLPDEGQGNLAETSPTKNLSAGAKKMSVIGGVLFGIWDRSMGTMSARPKPGSSFSQLPVRQLLPCFKVQEFKLPLKVDSFLAGPSERQYLSRSTSRVPPGPG